MLVRWPDGNMTMGMEMAVTTDDGHSRRCWDYPHPQQATTDDVDWPKMTQTAMPRDRTDFLFYTLAVPTARLC